MEKRNSGFRKSLIGLIAVMIVLFLNSSGNADWTPVSPPDLGINWGLQGVHFLSTTDGWAVGINYTNKRGVTLQFHKGSWESVPVLDVSSDWELHSVFFTSTGHGWAVGVDHAGERGVLLEFTNTSTDVTTGSWTVVIPPDVSPNWGLYGVHFTSAAEGWAVGVDYSNQRGVLLHYLNGLWTNVIPPDVSTNWGLYRVHFTSGTEGWAVGVDRTGTRGTLLRYSKDKHTNENIWNVVTPPQVDSDWELSQVRSLSSTYGWAVGIDHVDKSAVLLHWDGSTWISIIPPEVSPDWELTDVQFTSSNNGWAVGIDYANGTGVLLQAEKGSWTVVTPPPVSSDWELNGVRFIGANDGWAVGFDQANGRGVLLRYSAPTAKETVSAPALPDGPTSGAPGIVYTYTAGGSLTSLDHSIQYFFDWGDGTNSGWLPVNTLSASKSWTSPGNYTVKAQAQCATHNSVVSKWSPGLSVNISSSTAAILLRSPGDDTHFDSCSLYSLPTFTWDVTESFSSYEVQFSKTDNFSSIAAKGSTSSTTFPMKSNIWSKVLLIPGMTGGPVFWRVVGTGANKTTATSGVFSITIDPAEAVGNLGIVNTSKSSLPTLSWENNCNIKYKVWFGRDGNFSKETGLAFNIKNPIANGGLFTNTLKLTQWKSVRAVVGDRSGSTIYWYVESWDGLKRHNKTDVMSFVLTE